MSTDWKGKLLALTLVLGFHWVGWQCWHTLFERPYGTSAPYRAGLSSVTFTVTPASMPPGLQQGPQSVVQQPRPHPNVDDTVRNDSPSQYLRSEQLDTRAAPSLLVWNIDKRLLQRDEPTSLVFTVWISATGTIDALEPHTRNEKPWVYDDLAKALQTTLMVPATVHSQAVASTMTVELVLDSND